MSAVTVFAGDFAYHASSPAAAFPALTAPQMKLDVSATSVKLIAETQNVEFSFNGKDVHGTIKPADGPVDFHGISKKDIWFRSAGGAIRAWAWHNG